MNNRWNARILLWLFVVFSNLAAYGQAGDYAQAGSALLQQAVDDGQVMGIAAGFSKLGKVTWSAGLGYRNAKEELPFSATTPTRIASVTKPFTAVAIMQLYERGEVDLDKPLQTYLPDFPVKQAGVITLRQLLGHTAGIDDYQSAKERENQVHYPSLAAAVALFQDRDLVAPPGTAFHYTTYGYVLLGLVIEEVSGLPYEEFLKTNIWGPAGMSNTCIEYRGREYPEQSLLYHQSRPGKIKEADATDLSDRIPGGGIQSTVEDLLKFGDALIANTLLKPDTQAIMFADHGLKQEGNGYGLGWYLYGENPQYGNVVGHTGGQTGASAMFMLLPAQQTTIVVLANTSGALQRVSNIAVQLFPIAAQAGS
ncbi:MAG: beta-lactamase family protein [Lewinellaceae bacterium]|nr:beta-lactamase family protein [Lewinellaceae bacterium]